MSSHLIPPQRIEAALKKSRNAVTRARLLTLMQKVSAAEFASDADVVTLERAEFENAQMKGLTNNVRYIADYRRAS